MSPHLDFSVVFVFAIVFIILYRWIRSPSNLPPGPTSWPLIGSFLTIAWETFTSGLGFHELLTSFSKTYGKIFTLNLFGKYMIVISEYQLLKEALNNPKINDRNANSLSTKVFGTNAKHFNYFQNYRRFAMTTFRQLGVGRQLFEQKVAAESTELRQELAKMVGKSTDLHGFLNNATTNVICSVVFGRRYQYTDVGFMKLIDMANRINDALGAGGFETYLPVLNLVPTKAKREIISLEDAIRQFVNDIIVDHSNNFDSENINDFLDAYLHEKQLNDHRTVDEYSFLTDDNIRGSLTSLFVAGGDTTSTVINWGILYLISNPDIQSRVQSELDSVIGRNRFPRITDKVHLPYTRAVLQEVYRITGPVPLAVLHEVSEDTSIGPFYVPKGATVVPNIWGIHRDPQVWINPNEFNPERFLNHETLSETQSLVIPFSIGRRSCPGEALAQAMVFIFFTHLLHQFRFEIPEDSPRPSLEGELGIVYKPAAFQARIVQRDAMK